MCPLRDFLRKDEHTGKRKLKKCLLLCGARGCFKRMVEIKQENGVKNGSIREIMRQKGLTGRDVQVGGPTFHWGGVMQTPPRWEGGLAS